MIKWRINVTFLPGDIGNGIIALKKIVDHLHQNLDWPEIRIFRGFIGAEENYCEVEADFHSLTEFEKAWQKWGKSPESKDLAERYHQVVSSEKIEIFQVVD